MREKYSTPMVAIVLLLIIPTAYLIFIESGTPGFCPPYPVLGIPTCIVVEVYFVLILGSLFWKSRVSNLIFYGACVAAFLTSLFLSIKDVMGLAQCPQLFGVPLPLCFTVFPTMGLLMFLKYRGQSKRASHKEMRSSESG